MESAELDGLEGEEAELAAWERAAEALADRMDGNRQTMAGGGPGLEADLDRVDQALMPPPGGPGAGWTKRQADRATMPH